MLKWLDYTNTGVAPYVTLT